MTPAPTDASLTAFARLAEDLCAAIENSHGVPWRTQLGVAHALLSRVYAAALALPLTAAVDGEDVGEVRETSGECAVPSLDDLAEALGERRYYREIFDPYSDKTGDDVTGDLVDDLRDVFRDLARGLGHWHAGNASAAQWEWRFSFQSHWGEHATSALRALYALSAWHGIPWPTDAEGPD